MGVTKIVLVGVKTRVVFAFPSLPGSISRPEWDDSGNKHFALCSGAAKILRETRDTMESHNKDPIGALEPSRTNAKKCQYGEFKAPLYALCGGSGERDFHLRKQKQ